MGGIIMLLSPACWPRGTRCGFSSLAVLARLSSSCETFVLPWPWVAALNFLLASVPLRSVLPGTGTGWNEMQNPSVTGGPWGIGVDLPHFLQ